MAVGDTVYVAGNPEGLEGTFSQGIISAVRGRYIQITAPISHGSSGGPVLNQKGEVIGIAASSFNEGQNLNFAIGVSDLQLLLGRMTLLVNLFPPSSRVVQRSEGSTFSRPVQCRDQVLPNEILEHSNNFKLLTKDGESYFHSQQYENAIGAYDRAVYLKPLLPEPYYLECR